MQALIHTCTQIHRHVHITIDARAHTHTHARARAHTHRVIVFGHEALIVIKLELQRLIKHVQVVVLVPHCLWYHRHINRLP